MTFVLAKTLKGFKPLAVSGHILYVCQGHKIYVSDVEFSKPRFLCAIPEIKNIVSSVRLRLVDRILRRDISTAILFENFLFVVVRNQIWKVDLTSGTCSLDFEIPAQRRPLNLSIITDSSNGEKYLAFGEYFKNFNFLPVHFWRRSMLDDQAWHIAATIEQGEINHVHNIIQDPKTSKLYLLVGDFENAAGIWTCDSDFSNVTPLVRGRQEYRAVWAWCNGEGQFVYATDSQFSINKFYSFNIDRGVFSSSKIADINGSSIYCGVGKDYLVFSTSVEPGELSGNYLKDVFDQKRGPGILSDNAVLYCYDKKGEVNELFRAQKDFMPARLGQFGSFMFPSGEFPADRFIAYGVAISKYDDTSMLFTLVD